MYDEMLSEVNRIMKNYQEEESYNIFDVLEVSNKEVPMCRFLADVLNPQGRHRKGSYFLRTFLEEVLGRNDAEEISESARVHKEYLISGERRIDIVIETDKVFIPIEVKIYAQDQDSQCFDYFSYAKKVYRNRGYDPAKVQVVYLTLYGDEPSSASLANHDGTESLNKSDYVRKSFAEDILHWLKKLVCEKTTDLNMREVLSQYADAIMQLTSMLGEEAQMKIIEEVMKSEENFRGMLALCKVEKEAKTQLLRDFMEDMEKSLSVIADEFNLERENKFYWHDYNREAGENFYQHSSITTYPGFSYVFKDVVDLPGKIQMWLRVEIDWHLQFGICLFDPNANGGKGAEYDGNGDQAAGMKEELLCKLKEHINLPSETMTDWWIKWWFLPTGTDFASGDFEMVPEFKGEKNGLNDAAQSMADKDKRAEFIRKSIDVIREKLTKILV